MSHGDLDAVLGRAASRDGPVVVLTGAGVSAESGIPTFRGVDGYWRVGSKNYHRQELATRAAFERMPDVVWSWYLARRATCRAAEPNAAHRALVELERGLGDGFVLVTQNVDGLHLRAGSSPERTWQVHGNLDFMRCLAECAPGCATLPETMAHDWPDGRALTAEEAAHLKCARCGGRSRPHVLWFDECYDEEHFRFESAQRAALSARLLVVIGTAGQTNLPLRMGALAAHAGAPMIVVDPDAGPFTDMAEHAGGVWLRARAGACVGELSRRIAAVLT